MQDGCRPGFDLQARRADDRTGHGAASDGYDDRWT
jgi:hypothetical protein